MSWSDTELLIMEVEKRPELYNNASKENCDRNLKNILWEEVFESVIPNWQALDGDAKMEKGKEVQKRWKSLRDCFRRELITQKNNPKGIGNCGNKRRKYLYFDQLQFLMPTVEQKLLTNSISPIVTKEYESVIVNEQDYTEDSEQHAPVVSRGHKPENDPFEKQVLQIMEKLSKPEDESDDDKQFLLSLLPTLKTFDESNKLHVRIEIMNTLMRMQRELCKQHEQNQEQHTKAWQPSTSSAYHQ